MSTHLVNLIMSLASEDKWIANHSSIGAERLHAIGYVTYFWNLCELSVYWLFRETLEVNDAIAWALYNNMGHTAVTTRIKAIIAIKSFTPEAVDSIHHALKVFDICRENRNQLTHFLGAH